MDLKKKMKNFFTLTRKADSGFTLVELIVVIAILAILGGVAVPAYSAYVNKANEAADRQMIADIEQALILGAYSEVYAPGTFVGAVGVSRTPDGSGYYAVSSTAISDAEGNVKTDVADMMEKVFGSSWQETLQLKSDALLQTDQATVLQVVNGQFGAYFDSVPDSSFYSAEGSSEAIVSDVDELVTALYKVLDKEGNYVFSKFWGDEFKESVNEGGLGDTWNASGNAQMAANLTAFAAANHITNIMAEAQEGGSESQAQKTLDKWVNSWTGTGEAITVNTSNNAYVVDLAMKYGECMAMYNYAVNTYPDTDQADTLIDKYKALESAMQSISESDEGYVNAFNEAIETFWTGTTTAKLRKEWRDKGQAEKDAEALLASMAALNSLEDKYVSADQTELLNTKNAFAEAGAADVLDAMIEYSNMDIAGEYVILLSVGSDGTPIVNPSLQGE